MPNAALTSHKSALFKTASVLEDNQNMQQGMGESLKPRGRRSTGKLGLTIIPEKRATQTNIEMDR
jgi:hypothetical protein